MTMPLRRILMLVSLVGVAACSQATPEILKQFKSIYNKPDANCMVCHTKPPTRNAFGKAVEGALNKTNDGLLTREVMKPLEAQDSDGDGVSNIDEINAGTSPGDPNSKPAAGATTGPEGSAKKETSSELVPKHSFHPAIVHFPVALLAIAALLEIFAIRTKKDVYHSASVINLALGLITAAGAILTGVAAWLRLGYKIEGDLLIHLLLASASVLVGIAAYTQRGKPTYMPLVLVSGGLVLAAGHFGGNMVYG